MNPAKRKSRLPFEHFGPCFETWDVNTKNLYLEQKLLQLETQLRRQEQLADNQRKMFKTILNENEDALIQLKKKNFALQQLSEELTQCKADLEKEVRKRTRALEKKNASLEGYTRQLEQSNIALDVLLGRHERDRKALIKDIAATRNLVAADLKALRLQCRDPEHQSLIDRLLSKLESVDPGASPGISHWQTQLSERESTVARLIAQGHNAATVSDILHISLRCVHSHCYNIRKKLGLSRKVRLKDYLKEMANR